MNDLVSETGSGESSTSTRTRADAASAIDRCFEVIDLDISHEEFQRLPRNLAYKYEYFDGHALLTPRPKIQFARLELPHSLKLTADLERDSVSPTVRALDATDWRELRHAFAFAFERMPPFGTLPRERRLPAAEDALRETRDGLHGEVVENASCVALDGDARAGACIITLPTMASWQPQEMSGQPHLSWIFVSPMAWRQGVASALLSHAAKQLEALGHCGLYSTLLVGNAPSTFWHWRMGFCLLEDPLSLRRYR